MLTKSISAYTPESFKEKKQHEIYKQYLESIFKSLQKQQNKKENHTNKKPLTYSELWKNDDTLLLKFDNFSSKLSRGESSATCWSGRSFDKSNYRKVSLIEDSFR